MSVTFYVEGWSQVPMKEVRIDALDEYPELEKADFFGSQIYQWDDSDVPYRMAQVPVDGPEWPTVRRTGSTAGRFVSRMLDNPSDEELFCGYLSAEAVAKLPGEDIPAELYPVIDFARERKKGIYWT